MGRKIPMWQVLLVFAFTIAALVYAIRFTDYGELHIPLICSAIVAAAVAVLNGYKWGFLEAGILASINRSMQAMLILMIVGLLIGAWIAGGVVPAMIYYGLMILKPGIFLFAGCIICCIVSLATGSSWTTAGTIGVALIGVGMGLGISPAMTAGAIVSGAYFGDKMSPLSDTTNLAPAIAGSTLFNHIRHMVYTVTPSLIIALILYAILGVGHSSMDVDMSNVTMIQNGMLDEFSINPALLIPPLIVILIVALRLPAIPGLIGGVLLGCLAGGIFQGVQLNEWFAIVHYGYESTSEVADIADLLTRGGMDSMMWTINLIICAMCFGGVMDSSGMLGTLAKAMLKFAKGTGSLVAITVFSCIVMNIIAADQYLAIILPGRMYKEAYEDRRLDARNLSRVLEDSGTMTSSLVPWNTCGATMSTFLGVQQFSGVGGGFVKYAYLNLVNPLVSMFYGFTGITMMKMTDEQYAEILEQREQDKALALKSLEA